MAKRSRTEAPSREPATAGIDDPELRTRMDALLEDGWDLWARFDSEVRTRHWHPFVAANYERVLHALLPLRAPGLRFLEWGSATGVITIMADLLGFEAWGIELDAPLVDTARTLASRHHSHARFTVGSFVPAGYRWTPSTGDGRLGTIGDGTSAYPAMGHPLEDFDLVFAYPWGGEEPMMLDLMRAYGGSHARFLLNGDDGVRVYGPAGGHRDRTVSRNRTENSPQTNSQIP